MVVDPTRRTEHVPREMGEVEAPKGKVFVDGISQAESEEKTIEQVPVQLKPMPEFIQKEGPAAPPVDVEKNVLEKLIPTIAKDLGVDKKEVRKMVADLIEDKPFERASGTEVRAAVTELLASEVKGVTKDDAIGIIDGVIGAQVTSETMRSQAEKISGVEPKPSEFAKDSVNMVMNLVDGSKEMIGTTLKAIEANPEMIPEKDREPTINFLRFLSDAVSELKEMLNKMRMIDAVQGREAAKHKRTLIEQEFKAKMDQIKKEAEAYQKQVETQKTVNTIMTIVGVLALIGGILAAPFTGGSSVGAAIVAVVSITLAVATFVMQHTGVMGKMFEAINEGLEELVENMDPNAPEWVKDLVKAVTYAAVVVAVIGVTAASRGATSNVTAKVLATVICMALVTTIVSGANLGGLIVDSIAGGIAGEEGKEHPATKIVGMLLTVAITILTAVIGGKISTNDAGLDKAVSLFKNSDKLKDVGRSLTAIAGLGKGTTSVVHGFIMIEIGKMQEKAKGFEAQEELIKGMIKVLEAMIQKIQSSDVDMREWSQMLTNILKKEQVMQEGLANKI